MIKQLLLATAVLATVGAQAQQQSYNDRARQYIAKYKDWALEEQRRCGVPAAITLAQGIFETSAGNSELATQANNHFGIKCRREWTGETFAHDDDAPQECFRKYPDARQSYKDHSDYLKNSKRYATCFAQDVSDYKSWARELKRCGYATNPKYAPQLVKIVEDFGLQDYTLAAASGAIAPVLMASAGNPAAAVVMAEKQEKAVAAAPEHDTPAPNSAIVYGQATKKDGLRGFYAKKGDVLLEYAIQYKLRYARLLEMNGLPDAPLAQDQFIYLEKGMRVTQLMAHDASAPAPLVAAATTPAAPPSVYRPAEKVSTPAAVTAAAPPPAPRPVETRPAPTAVAVNTPSGHQDYLKIAQPAGEVEARAEKPVNIANEIAVEEDDDDEKAVLPAAGAPKNDFDRLKARFDRVVYEPAKRTAAPAMSAPAPVTTAPATAQVEVPAAALSNGRQFHTVKSGETAFGIARQYGITMKQLMDMNSLNFEAIKVGQKLRVK